jgi:hypothetical protein
MYSTCIFCHTSLGENESIEHFPVGSRLAFDAEKGRLWAVCPTCGRWNLSPLEERWEALEDCERRFRDTTVRTSTENIGLARLRDGTDLVRVGRPLRPEFAAWRYGAQFRGRQTRTLLSAVSAGGAVLGLGVALATNPLGLLVGVPLVLAAEWKKLGLPRGAGYFDTLSAQRTLRDDAGMVMATGGWTLDRVRMRPDRDRTDGRAWALHVRTVLRTMEPQTGYVNEESHHHVVSGAAGLRALAVLMARANGAGAPRAQVQNAVRHIDRARSAEGFLGRAEEEARKRGVGYRDVWDMPLEIRLAMEMAAHEDAERRALEGELVELERHWREAEELASIADGLPMVPAVEEKLDTLRAAREAWAKRGAPRGE